jgi:hypothetical protein
MDEVYEAEVTAEGENIDAESRKKRKSSQMSKLNEDYVLDDKAITQATSNWNKGWNKRKRAFVASKSVSKPVAVPFVLPKPKVKPVVIKPPNAKQREEILREDALLSDYEARLSRLIPVQYIYKLREKPCKVSGVSEAIAIGLRESNTLPLDWTDPQVRLIGRGCKVYWDGDDAWYYARIVHYDAVHKKHLVS